MLSQVTNDLPMLPVVPIHLTNRNVKKIVDSLKNSKPSCYLLESRILVAYHFLYPICVYHIVSKHPGENLSALFSGITPQAIKHVIGLVRKRYDLF